jgi:cytochrome c biogenesis protein
LSAIGNRPPEGGTPRLASAAGDAYKFLSSTRFTIFLLSLIAVSCVAGTLLPQQATPEEYLQRYTESTYLVLKFLGLTNVFHSPWFVCLTGFFVVNLLLCTFQRLGRFLGSGAPEMPNEASLLAMPLTFFLEGADVTQAAGLFRGYKACGQGPGRILEKGKISRYGVYIIHGSIVIILVGSLIGLFGFRGFVTLGKGDTRDSAVKRGSRETIPLGFAIKLDDFKISFYPGGEPREYMSRVEIIDNGKTVKEAEVRVNHPLSYRGTSIYQASYGSDPVFLFDIGGEEARLGQGSAYKKGPLEIMVVRFERSIHDFGPGVQVAYLEGGETKTSWFVKDVPRLREKEIMGVPVRLKGIGDEFYTGLEVVRDPGIWVVWTGFALILFGLYVNFFMCYRRIYLLGTSEGVLVAGTSSRNKEAFREEFEKWREKAHGIKR